MKNTPTTVLIVDDEKEILDVLESLLLLEGLGVFRAHDGQEAWGILERENVDVVLSDVRMPEMSGTELLRKVQSESKINPVFYLASGDAYFDQDELAEMGADGFLEKPFDFSYVVKLLQEKVDSIKNQLFKSNTTS